MAPCANTLLASPSRRSVFPLLLLVLWLCVPAVQALGRVTLGIDVLAADHPELVRGKRLAVLVSAASLDGRLEHTIDRLARAATIETIFTGETYFRPTLQGASGSPRLDALTNAPVHELLDALKRPVREDLRKADLILVDLQDIGIRYFNYITLLAQFLELAREADLPIIVLDRPNPINGHVVSGPVLEVSFRSKFGVYPVPLVYGMTFGELALLFNKEFGLGAKLTVIGMEGYDRRLGFRATGHHWLPPSDHLPEPESPSYYAITGILGELGVFSTGVGTTRPFHYLLAPWIDGELLAHTLNGQGFPGVGFVPVQVRAYYGLFQGKRVPGVEIVIRNRLEYDPVLLGVGILATLFKLYPDRIPLENQAVSQAIDTLLGGSTVRTSIVKGIPPRQIAAAWGSTLAVFLEQRARHLMYPEQTIEEGGADDE